MYVPLFVQLNYALEDVTILDEGLKQYMDGDGRRQSPSVGAFSWRRVSEAYLRPLVSLRVSFLATLDVFGLLFLLPFVVFAGGGVVWVVVLGAGAGAGSGGGADVSVGGVGDGRCVLRFV